MKRVLLWILCLALAMGLAAPALANGEEPEIDLGILEPGETDPLQVPEDTQSMDEALSQVTLQVKETLGVDDGYTSFYGDYRDGVVPGWSLNWSDEKRELNVEVRTDGTVDSLNYWQDGDYSRWFYGFDPVFPALTYDEAREQAEDWCGRLFTGAESAQPEDIRIVLGEEGFYRISGTVYENGLPSPITFTMVISGEGLTSFYRSDSYAGYVGELPSADPGQSADPDTALAGAVELELRWVSDGESGARLMYVPVGPYTVVDAQTGEAVDMDALYAQVGSAPGVNGYGADASAETAMAADGGVSLTETELASIANYGDVLDEESIDEALRDVALLGLDGFELGRCSYAAAGDTGDVTASVRFTKTMTEDQLYGYSAAEYANAVAQGRDMTIYKYITLDAKTGDIQSVSTSYPLWEREENMIGLVDQAGFAQQFVELAVPELAAKAELCTLHGYDEAEDLTFAQVHEGYFFPDNYIRVHVDPTSGTVDEFYYNWDEDVSFGPAEEPVSVEDALDAYTGALEVTLGYVAWPIDVEAADEPLYAEYVAWGYRYVEQLRLAYYYDGIDAVEGVDAVTGEAVRAEQNEDAYTYDDLDGVPQAAMIERLGQAGVGFSGSKFLPEEALTMRDAVTLLLRAGGVYAAEDDERLAEQAYYEGFLSDRDWDPEQETSRIAFLRMMTGPSKYGPAAELHGVWDTGFADVDEADEAVAAIARALGLAEGDTLAPDETLTRAQAAELLYKFMDR